jgi:hypothetical protein
MRFAPLACLVFLLSAGGAQAGEWQVQTVRAPARVTAIDPTGDARIDAGGLWYRLSLEGANTRLTYIDESAKPETPENALPHGRIAVGTRDIARAWLSDPTPRYDHGVLGDKLTAGSLTIEPRDGKMQVVRLKDDAVFEDLTPRLADLDGDGRDEVALVKSYLRRGSALAIIGRREAKYTIIAETPPIGSPNRWLNPAGIADFDGDGKVDIALVRMPHTLGQLELWSWSDKGLTKTGEFADTTNHIAGSRALDMSVVADFDDDRIPDLAIPSFDRSRLRLISFVPEAHEIASIALPAKAVTNLARVSVEQGTPAVAVGLADGTLALVRQGP